MLDTIRIGDTNNLVKIAQYLTNYTTPKNANENFSDYFFTYIQSWQAKNGLIADGIIGQATWKKIAEQLPTCSTSKNRKSAYVCGLQILLGGLTADGIYGTNTKNAVAAYQTANGLSADGICGKKTWNMLIVGGNAQPSSGSSSTQSGKVLNNCVHYLQWDSKWKRIRYSTHTDSQTIGNSGCGPTAMAMIMATWINSKITPVEMCKLAVDNGYRTYNSGTSWGFFKFVFKQYGGFGKYIETSSIETLKAALREGALAVCSMNPNDNNFWTKSGHFITARGVDDTYIYANDPNNKTVPRKQAHSKFANCMKQAFIFWPKQSEPEPEPTKKEVAAKPATATETPNLNGKIIDISKWQGNIDFGALKPEVSLVIARASCGSDKDIKIDEYAKEMNKHKIPFGVYCYSYAGTKEKAIDEAQKMVKYAEQYDPLFYVLDAEETKLSKETIEEFANELRKQTNKKIGCYVANHKYDSYKYAEISNKFDFTWIPSYGKNDGTVSGSKKPTHFCDLWQYTSTANIAGIQGHVDMNIITGDGHDLQWFLTK